MHAVYDRDGAHMTTAGEIHQHRGKYFRGMIHIIDKQDIQPDKLRGLPRAEWTSVCTKKTIIHAHEIPQPGAIFRVYIPGDELADVNGATMRLRAVCVETNNLDRREIEDVRVDEHERMNFFILAERAL